MTPVKCVNDQSFIISFSKLYTMYSKVKIFNHPLHVMLVGFPVAFYTATLVAFIMYHCQLHMFWFKVGVLANLAGVAMAALAALPGFIDWLAIPSSKGAKKTGMYHMFCNVGALVLFAVNLFLQYPKIHDTQPESILPIVLSAIGFCLTLAAGFLGWTLVQNHHIGVSLTAEQQKLEPTDGVK